jgi:redox-sensitive bicupin YhaK (pirin superfamily)
MPAITPPDLDRLPTLAEPAGTPRAVHAVVTAQDTYEGGGFLVHRPFPQPGADLGATDPFLMLDEMGPVDYGPGEAKGAPDHPHRGFETVTYLFDGEMEHRDSAGGGGVLRGGDTQWMTAGAGLVHSEMPTATMLRDGGRSHGIQLWVNLPRADKLLPPRYQDIPGDELTFVRTADGRGLVRVVAGSVGGHAGPGSTHTPIVYAHATLQAGAHLAVGWPPEWNALVYVIAGRGRAGRDGEAIAAHQLAVLSEGDSVVVDADEPMEVLLLGGQPLREPVAWYGPFVMNTKAEIIESVEMFERGELGTIAPA